MILCPKINKSINENIFKLPLKIAIKCTLGTKLRQSMDDGTSGTANDKVIGVAEVSRDREGGK